LLCAWVSYALYDHEPMKKRGVLKPKPRFASPETKTIEPKLSLTTARPTPRLLKKRFSRGLKKHTSLEKSKSV